MILGKKFSEDDEKNNRYTRAKNYFNNWLKQGILIRDLTENIYFLSEDFEIEGKNYKREGFIVILKLEEFDKGNILPHEKTLKGPKIDRFNLIKECKANFSQIFCIFSDPSLETIKNLRECACSTSPYFSFTLNNINYNFWKIHDKKLENKIQEILKDKKIFIADGHHRYETALLFRNYIKEKLNISEDVETPYDYVMVYLCPMEDEGLVILPTHRVVKNLKIDKKIFLKNLENYFKLKSFAKKDFLKAKEELNSSKKGSFLLYLDNNFYLLNPLQNNISKLDVEILEEIIFKKILKITDEDISMKKKIDFIKNEKDGIEGVENGSFSAFFMVKPPKMEEIKKISLNRGILPQKTTYFYPKLLTGLVIYSLE